MGNSKQEGWEKTIRRILGLNGKKPISIGYPV